MQSLGKHRNWISNIELRRCCNRHGDRVGGGHRRSANCTIETFTLIHTFTGGMDGRPRRPA